jgi:hypothetical protein
VFRRSPTTPTWRLRMYRRLVAAAVALTAVGAGVGVVASPAQADVQPQGHVWYEGIIRSWAQGRCLDSNHAGEVYSIPCNFGSHQKWKVIIWTWPDNQFPTVQLVNVATGRFLSHLSHSIKPGAETPVQTLTPFEVLLLGEHVSTWRLFPAYPNKWDAWVFSVEPGRYCLDANLPFDTTGKRPYVRQACGSNYQDWKMGF